MKPYAEDFELNLVQHTAEAVPDINVWQTHHNPEDLTLNNISKILQGGDDWEEGRCQARSDLRPQATQPGGSWRLKRTIVRRCARDDNSDVKQSSEYSQADQDTCDGDIDGRHISAEPGGEEEQCDLEHDGETFDEQVEWPFLEPVAFALTVSATVDH